MGTSHGTGVVEDETRAAIAGAKVTLNQDTRAMRSTISREDGTFIFEDVSPASYVLTVEMTGFETSQKAVAIGPQPLKPLRIMLRVKAIAEDVTVEAESTDRLSTSASDAATTKVDDDWLRKLPIASDDVLALIGKFVSPSAQGAAGASSLFAARNAFAQSVPDVGRRLLQPSVFSHTTDD